ncbi:MAG: polysaccharide pyruvyl transferase family protein [Phototrophicaceae bacterium]
MQKTVGVIGGTIWGNRGAEAMLVTAIGKVREKNPNTKIIIFSYLPSQDKELLNDPTIAIHDARPLALVLSHLPFSFVAWLLNLVGLSLPNLGLFKSAYALSQCDILLDVGGISFADGREKFLPFNILIILPAVLMGVKVVKLSQAMGSFKNPVNRLASRLFLPLCHQIYARGIITASYLENLHLKPTLWKHVPDVAFLYQSSFTLSNENNDKVAQDVSKLTSLKAQGTPIIVLSPSSVVFEQMAKQGKDYIAVFLRLISSLSPSYHYLVVPNATRENSEKLRNNDLIIIDMLRLRAERELPYATRNRIQPILYDLNTASSRELLEYGDVMVTSRFHGMISALSLALPTCVIGWSHKYEEILAEFGMEKFAIDYKDVDENLAKTVENLLQYADDWQQKIKDCLPKVKAQSQIQFDNLDLDN